MNFGCPVPKVTRKGGGSALPVHRRLLRDIVRAAVAAAGPVPVTIKFRMGVDDAILTYLDTGRIAEEEGVAAIALHARTAEQLYSGAARWDAIAALKAAVATIPVLGNGDIWEAARRPGDAGPDRLRRRGRRPGLPRPALAVPRPRRRLRRTPGAAAAATRRGGLGDARPRASAWSDWSGEVGGMKSFRKHAGWYLTGYPVGGATRKQANVVATLADLDRLLDQLDPEAEIKENALRAARGHTNGPRRVHPSRRLARPESTTPPRPRAPSSSSAADDRPHGPGVSTRG